jgi:hypothetical protein
MREADPNEYRKLVSNISHIETLKQTQSMNSLYSMPKSIYRFSLSIGKLNQTKQKRNHFL